MSYPTTPGFKAVNIDGDSPTLITETDNGRMQSRKKGTTRWSFTLKYPPLTRDQFKGVQAFIMAQQGRHGVFTIVPPIVGSSGGNASGSITCSAAVKGATSVTIAGITGSLEAGDFVKFAGHDKVYMLTADRSGAGAMSITPPLIAAVSATEQLVYVDVPFTVRLNNDLQTYKIGVDSLYSYEVDVIEAI